MVLGVQGVAPGGAVRAGREAREAPHVQEGDSVVKWKDERERQRARRAALEMLAAPLPLPPVRSQVEDVRGKALRSVMPTFVAPADLAVAVRRKRRSAHA